MKKVYTFIIFIILFFPTCIKADALKYDEAIKMVQEVMKQYYIRGPYIQYNYSKALYTDFLPEDATFQDNKYLVCASFTHSVYNQAFGIKGDSTFMSGPNTFKDNTFPQYNYHIIYAAQSAYQKIKKGTIPDNGTQLLYYQSNVNTTDTGGDGQTRDREIVKYVYGDNDTTSNTGDYETLVKNVRPGDLFFYSGHALIAYDVVDKDGDGVVDDVLILNSNKDNEIFSTISGTSALFYDASHTTLSGSYVFDLEKEGTIKLMLLSSNRMFVTSSGVLRCYTDYAECAVIRGFYKGNGGEAVFNFHQTVKASSDVVERALLRTKYPGLLIEKTVSTGDNNTVYVGDELTYTITIANKSNVDKGNVSYDSFIIEEKIDNNVEYVSATNNAEYSNGVVKWNIPSLNANSSVTLTYTVKVKNNTKLVGNSIQSIGKFYSLKHNFSTISTGTVINKIIPKVLDFENTYEYCFGMESAVTGNEGLNLINEVYKCALNKDFMFYEFDFEKLFQKNGSSKASSTLTLKSQLDSNHENFKNMILNNYLGGLVIKSSSTHYLPRWNKSSVIRAETINEQDFKDGDVLIYSIGSNGFTNENGLYAFIYINGKFQGINYSDTKMRNFFDFYYYLNNYTESQLTSKFYEGYQSVKNDNQLLEFLNYQTLFGKENYIILRPELVIKELNDIEILNGPNKTIYVQNQDNLDLTGGNIQLIYNNGEVEIVSMTNANVQVSNFDNSELGVRTIQLNYNGKVVEFNVTISDAPAPDASAPDEQKPEVVPPDTGAKEFIVWLLILTIIYFIIRKYLKKNVIIFK